MDLKDTIINSLRKNKVLSSNSTSFDSVDTNRNFAETSSHNSTNTGIDITNQSDSSSSWFPSFIGHTYQSIGNESNFDKKRIAKFASLASWIVNWFLLISKLKCFIISESKAVLAALADSAVDLVSQALLSLAEWHIGKHNPNYPVGRSRLEALSVLACASIMIFVSVEVIQLSVDDLSDGINGVFPDINIDKLVYILLVVGVLLKLALYIFCSWAYKVLGSDSLKALAEDHLNDVMSNSLAVITASIAYEIPSVWWLDAAGAIFISLIIIYRWFLIISEQVKKIVGHTAPPEFLQIVETIAASHDARLTVDVTRAYHFGARYNVEMEIVLPGQMTVMESHDIALALQHKIESLSDVERAFVHVDHQGRDGLEHKIERHLVTGVTSPMYQIQINKDSSTRCAGVESDDIQLNPLYQLSKTSSSSSGCRTSSCRTSCDSEVLTPAGSCNTPDSSQLIITVIANNDDTCYSAVTASDSSATCVTSASSQSFSNYSSSDISDNDSYNDSSSSLA